MMNEKFKEFIIQLLERTKLKKKYIYRLCNDESNLLLFRQAFTHSSFDDQHNYEFFELLGDATCNKIIVWYLKDRFPFLQNQEGVKIISRLRINLVSKKNFFLIASNLGFAPFILCQKEIMVQRNKNILEDVFEAFIGVTEYLLDKYIYPGSGYGICFRFLKHILDQQCISLQYEDLYDPITRLKETLDYYRSNQKFPEIWGSLSIEHSKIDQGRYRLFLYQVNKSENNKKELLYTITCQSDLDEGKQLICNIVLKQLEQKGYKRPIPNYYDKISTLISS